MKNYSKKQLFEAISYWTKILNESSTVYLQGVSPKNGVKICDERGNYINFDIQLNRNNGVMTPGWSGINNDKSISLLSNADSKYDGKDISILQLKRYLKDNFGYELIDER